ncbi:MAG: hypothetical protein WC959_10900 [Kiritimatiellales bacterium]
MKKRFFNLTRKGHVRSTEAAIVSIAVHVVLILLAGSIVAVRIIQKRNAEFTVSTSTPKLERRQLQMPSKMEKLRETSRAPKIVSRRTSSSSPSFTAPDMGKVGAVSTQKFTMPFARSGRDFSVLMRGIGTSAPQIKFFGIRAQGEKFIFVIDASVAMITEDTGKTASFAHIKDQLNQTLKQLPSSVLFNVILHDGDTVCLFRPAMVPVTESNSTAMVEWLAPVNSDIEKPGLTEEQNNYTPREVYNSAMGTDVNNWILGLQAAFEQRPDTVFIVGAGWNKYKISKEKGELLLDFSMWELFGGGGQMSVANSPLLKDDRTMRDDLLKQAVAAIQKDEEARRIERKPTDFVHSLLNYVEYSDKQVIGHAETVFRRNYLPRKLARPRVSFVRLMPEHLAAVADADTSSIRELVRNYGGEAGVYRWQDFSIARRRSSPAALSGEPSRADKTSLSEVNFFGAPARGQKFAFLLDASADMIRSHRGGTNAYAFIKDQLVKTVAELPASTQFNVILYDEGKTALFRPELSPVSAAAGLTEWLAPVNTNAVSAGLTDERNNYIPLTIYSSALAEDVKGLPRALQAAMEQGADSIYVVSTAIGRVSVDPEKGRRLLDFSVWGTLGATASSGNTEEDEMDAEGNVVATAIATSGNVTSGGIMSPLQEDRKQIAAMMRAALTRIGAENRQRQNAGLPPGFVHNISQYLDYTAAQVNAHISEVVNEQYIGNELNPPQIHTVCLAETTTRQTGREVGRDLKQLSEAYRGNMRVFRGAPTDDQIRKINRLIELKP